MYSLTKPTDFNSIFPLVSLALLLYTRGSQPRGYAILSAGTWNSMKIMTLN